MVLLPIDMVIEARVGTNTRFRDTLNAPLDEMPVVIRKAVPLVEEQDLHPEDALSVLVVAAWTIDPNKKRLETLLGLNQYFGSHYGKVISDPVLEYVCDQVAIKLDSQLKPEVTLHSEENNI